MSELCDSKTHFSSLLISDLILFISFLLSHPLYLSYFIFFSPYLIKLISFLSPLFITTFLLFLALFTAIVPENFSTFESTQISLLFAYTSIFLEKLRSQRETEDENIHCSQYLEIYKIVFGPFLIEPKGSQDDILEGRIEEESTTLQALETTMTEGTSNAAEGTTLVETESIINKNPIQEDPISIKREGKKIDENPNPIRVPEQEKSNKDVEKDEKRMENFLKVLDEFERMSSNGETKKKFSSPLGSNADKVVEKQKVERNGSKAEINNNNDNNNNKINAIATVCVDRPHDDDGKEYNALSKAHSQRIPISKNIVENLVKFESSRTLSQNHGSYGSMRKEKEWTRTLACKLFEERHNVDGGDGMDSLWETYDQNDSVKSKAKNFEKKKKKVVEQYEEEEEIDDHRQLCCLQALKLSAGKVSLGIGRPNIVKISKAVKGFGWLHHLSKHSKKVHNHGDHRY